MTNQQSMTQEQKNTLLEINQIFIEEFLVDFNNRFPSSWGIDRNFLLESLQAALEDYHRQKLAVLGISHS